MKKALLLIAVVFLATSCSRTAVLVKWADTFIYWKLDDVFDFSGNQSKPVKQAVQRSVDKLKKEWLPQVGRRFRNYESTLRQAFPSKEPAASALILKIEQDILELTITAWQIVNPEVKGAAMTLKWENWLAYKEAFEKQNRKILKNTEGKCEARFEDQIEDWIGALTDDQERKIEKFCEANTWPTDLRVKNRNHSLAWFEKQAGISQSTFSGENLFTALDGWVKNMDQASLPEYLEVKNQTRQALKETLSWFLLNLSDKQKKKLMERLGDRAQEIETL